MKDQLGREIRYLRVSITDRCNLRCRYCMPEDLPPIPHDSILRYEEILRLCGILARLGAGAIRVTGGEPLVRKGCMGFLEELAATPGVREVALTTNGTLLEPHLQRLRRMGLRRINLSLDTLEPDVFRRLTGRDELPSTLSALRRGVELGFRMKINCVPLFGVNETELRAIARLAEELPVDVRFIELMPAAVCGELRGLSTGETLQELEREYPDLTPDGESRGLGPARYYRSSRLKGKIGVISAVSEHFCAACNRIRLTSEGFLKLCLAHEDGVDLREPLRAGASDHELEEIIRRGVAGKPHRHDFDRQDGPPFLSGLYRIGG